MRWFAIICLWLATTGFATAQSSEEDKGFLTKLLQDSLGGEGRVVSIDGFAGALRSQATMEQITIADPNGVWLIMQDLSMTWNRAALLRGRIDIEALTAARVQLNRLPQSPPSELPAPEATEFQLPDLPVSVQIETLQVDQIVLGEPVLGERTQMALTASASLAEGAATAQVTARRTDTKQGQFVLDARIDETTDRIDLTLELTEAEDGIAARVLDLRGRPSVDLKIAGQGPLNDFLTDIALSTDGAERLSGRITTRGTGNDGIAFDADLTGDLAPLFPPAYAAFFGDTVSLRAQGDRAATGALNLSAFGLQTGASDLQGTVRLAEGGRPERLNVSGTIAALDDSSLALPIGQGDTRVRAIDLALQYDVEQSDIWTAELSVAALSHPEFSAALTQLSARGLLSEPGTPLTFDGDVALDIGGLELTAPELAQAAGDSLQGRLSIDYAPDAPLTLRGIDLSGEDFALRGDVDVSGLDAAFETSLDLSLVAQDLTRFSGLTGLALRGQSNFALAGTVDAGGSFDLVLRGRGVDLAIGIAQVDPLLAGQTNLNIQAVRDTDGTRLPVVTLQNEQLGLNASAALATGASTAQFDLAVADARLIDPNLDGGLTIEGSASQDARGWSIDARAAGPFDARADVAGRVTGTNPALDFDASLPDVSRLVPEYSGPAQVRGRATRSDLGWLLDTAISGPYDVSGQISGRVTGENAPDIDFDLSLPDLNPVVPSVSGPVELKGRAQGGADGIETSTQFKGPFNSSGAVRGRVTGANAPDIEFDLALPDVSPIVPDLSGPLSVQGRAQGGADGIATSTQFNGPFNSSGAVRGRVTGVNAPDIEFDLALPDVSPIVPALPGPLSVQGRAQGGADGIETQTDFSGPFGSTGTLQGRVARTDTQVFYTLRLPDVARAGAPISGPLALVGSARQSGNDWVIDTNVDGPGGAQASVSGVAATTGTVDIQASGTAPLGLSAPFIRPQSLTGQAAFDLRLNGAPRLESLSGSVRTSGARFAAPSLRAALEGIAANVQINEGRAQLSISGNVSTGGRVSVDGSIGLIGSLPANLALQLDELRVVDPSLYEGLASGGFTVTGPLATGALIAGRVDVSQAEIQVPSTGVAGLSAIPDVTHLSAPGPVRLTLERAGLDQASRADSGSGGGTAHRLDIRVNAPSRLFVRGRGLDAELGGQLRLTGTTQDMISAGRFDLVRGRLDILGKRFELDEGAVTLQGRLDPVLRFVASTDTATGTASVIIEGPASSPEVTFASTPEAPQDEVLAQIFFGRSVTQLSPFQTLQLASAVATLAGRGGGGVLNTLRLRFNVDDLDVTTDDEGNVGLRVGKYLSDNVYTDVLVGDRNDAGVSLNIDLTPSFTARGTLQSDGNSSIGLFFERDY